MKKATAIVLAAGSGSRMQSQTKKQFMKLAEKPVLYYSLKAFQESSVEEIVLVLAKEDMDYCRKEILEPHGITKVTAMVEGGAERYLSVKNGLQKANGEVCYIHDGARPFISPEKIEELRSLAEYESAMITAVPVKDTIKIIDGNGYIESSPNRNTLMAAQTPQVFWKELLLEAYRKMEECPKTGVVITDDATIVQNYTDKKVRVVAGEYSNIKLTTPEDMEFAELFIKS